MAQLWGRPVWRPDIAIDLGTATIRVASKLHGPIVCPSETGTISALCSGVVVNIEAVVAILEPILSETRSMGILRPRAVVCAPTDASISEREAIVESVSRAGASSVVVIPEPLAAAVGGKVDISSPYAQMVVDIGEGVTDCAIIRAGKIVGTAAVRGGCSALRKAIQTEIYRRRNFRILKHHAEEILRIGLAEQSDDARLAYPASENTASSVVSLISPEEAWQAVWPAVETITDMIKTFLKDVPHSLGSEIIDNGIHLTGGGALLAGMRGIIQSETKVLVAPVYNPLEAVVLGARAMLPIVAMLNMWKR
ncbi:protein MreBH [Geobacter sp. OR-1]|uniref:rod shape-determining protein n=1 Tax=Geobacter sp. OR-1 TaxID=1266765 RepID=UPI000542D926|nr:rod shape-determining protein [Geobacter sp. OR-1]GAM10857.1 protein MreBH [Geobacter sp. OR-1]